MRVAKFCERNVERTESSEAVSILRKKYSDVVQVQVVDCFRRCLECRRKPFCRIQFDTIESSDAESLVEKIIEKVAHF